MGKYINTFKQQMRINENGSTERTVLIRSKDDKSFRYDVSYKNGRIFKTVIQGNNQDRLNDKSFLNLIININVKKEMDYNKLRNFLAEIPDLYVKGIE